MVFIHDFPLGRVLECSWFSMHEVTPISILASALFEERIAWLCLIGVVCVHIYSQLVSSMGELTPLAVWAETCFGVVLAQTTFKFCLCGF